MAIASLCASRGSTGTPSACSRAFARYRACARNASLAQARRRACTDRVEAGAELVALAAVQRRDPGVLHDRLPEARVARRSACQNAALSTAAAGLLVCGRAHGPATVAEVTSAGLHVQLDTELPAEVAVGAGTAIFVCGWCYSDAGAESPRSSWCSTAPRSPSTAWRCRGWIHTGDHAEDPRSLPQRFWGLVRIEPPAGGKLELGAAARRSTTAGCSEAGLGGRRRPQPAAPLAVAWPAGAGGPRVAIAMATFEPPVELLDRQLESIRAQTHENWVCVVSDDCSRPERYEALEAAVAGDPRFVVCALAAAAGLLPQLRARARAGPARLGVRRDGRPGRPLVSGKARARCSARSATAQLVYSDARIVGRDGERDLRDVVGPRGATTTPICCRCWSPTPSPVRPRCSGASCSSTRCRSPRPVRPLPRPLDRPDRARPSARSRSCRSPALRLRPARSARRSGTPRANRMIGAARAARPTRARTPERVQMWRLHYFVDI